MPVANDRIPHRAFAILLPAVMIETGVLRGPKFAIEAVGTWAWLSVLLAVGLVALNVYLLVTVMRRHGFPAYPDLLEHLFGPRLGRVLLVLHGLSIALRLSRVSRVSGELITLELLDRTPVWAVILPSLIIAAVLARQGFEPVARYAAVLFPFYYAVMMIMLMLAQLRGDVAMLVDLTEFSVARVLTGALRLIPEMQGYTVLIVLLPWVWRPERVLRPVLTGVALVGALALLLATSTGAVIGRSAATLTWPTLELIEVVSSPSLLVERADAVFFMVWVLTVVDLSALTLVGSSYMLTAAVSRERNPRLAVPLVAAGAGVLALLPPGFLQVEEILRTGFEAVPIFEQVLPGLWWIASLLRRGGRR